MTEKVPDAANLVREMNAYYHRRAPWHDEYMNYRSQESTERLLAPLIERVAPLVQGRAVLEIACGTGNWTQVLASRARRVLATDVSDAALKIAMAKQYRKNNVEFVVADAYTLDGVDDKFDAAFAADWLSHVPLSLMRGFLEVLHRRLRPGATVAFLDVTLDVILLPAWKGLETIFDSEGNRIHRRELPDGGRFPVVKNFPNEAQLRQLLKGLATDITYYENKPLTRWLLTYRVTGAHP